jgi:hypothetical protein
MCPFCLSTLGLVVASTLSTGGLAALAVKLSRKRNHKAALLPTRRKRSDENVNPHCR